MEYYTVIDWDDTLFPSTYISNNKLVKELEDIENYVINILELSLKNSINVYIITNSQTGWVNHSAEKYIPKTIPYLEKTIIISARSMWENTFSNPYLWKWCSFNDLFKNLDKTKIILSIGDSNIERNCTRNISTLYGYKFKTIKFIDLPDLNILNEELKKLINLIPYIYTLKDKKKNEYIFDNNYFIEL